MKVVSAQTIATLESEASQKGFNGNDFMEAAGSGIAECTYEYIQSHHLPQKILLICGKGNNAGDAYVAGRYLLKRGFSVSALQPEPLSNCSPLCQKNGQLFLDSGGQLVSSNASFEGFSLILDGLFGTGFKGRVDEPYPSLIERANKSNIPILAIDIPSGLNGTTGEAEGAVIRATQTLCLSLPKSGFFLGQGWDHVGQIKIIDFGLPKEFIDKAQAEFNLITEEEAASLVPPIKRTRNKYQAGFVVGLAGSPNMPGAAQLSSLASLRAGSGIVKLLHPEGMQAALANSPYELIKVPYTDDNLDEVVELMNKAGATFVGPGLSRSDQIGQLLHTLIPRLEKPCVIDADALYFYAKGDFQLPQQVIFTPHTGEMQTLLHKEERLKLDFDTLKICQNYAEKNQVTLVLKGATTFIFHPGAPIQLNIKGDPGMATAGCGDVLTGIIASLLAQGLTTHQAALLGVYLHALSGEFAAQAHQSSHGLLAGDLISHLQNAFNHLISS